MPRCAICKHSADDHITFLLHGNEDDVEDDAAYPCIAFGCGCEDYEPELIDKYN